MPHQDVTKVVQIELRFFMGNNNAQNTLHAQCSVVPTLAELTDLGGTLSSWITDRWAPIAAEAWTCNEIVLTSLDSILGPRLSIPISPPQAGGLAVDALPANATIAIKEDIGRRGRGTAGRIFWIGLTEGQQLVNELTPAAQSAIIAALETLKDDVQALDNFEGLCVPHMVVGGVRPNPATATIVQLFTATDLTLDSQKDRLPFHKKKRRLPIA
jgi:hypothetical protein